MITFSYFYLFDYNPNRGSLRGLIGAFETMRRDDSREQFTQILKHIYFNNFADVNPII